MTGGRRHHFDQGKWCRTCGADSGVDDEVAAPCRRPVGRPPIDNPRRDVIRFRVTADEKARLERLAAASGYSSAAEYARAISLGRITT